MILCSLGEDKEEGKLQRPGNFENFARSQKYKHTGAGNEL